MRYRQEHQLSLAASVLEPSGPRQSTQVAWDRRSGRNLLPAVFQRPASFAAPGAPARPCDPSAGHGGRAGTGLILRDRQGATADFKLTVANTAEIEPILQQVVATDAVLCSDGAAAYRIASQHLGLAHRAINLSAGQRVIAGVYHIQNVNAYDSRLKAWMHRFHGVATKYLENYLGWRRWLERWGNANTPQMALDAALGREKHFQLLMQT